MADEPPPSLHDTVAAAYVKAAAAMMPHQTAHNAAARDEWLDRIEALMVDHLTPLLQPLVDHPDIPPEIKSLLAVGVNPEKADALSIVFVIIGALLFPLVQAFFAPASLLVAQKAFELPGNAVVPLSPEQAAAAVIKDIDPNRDWAAVAQLSGVDKQPFADMVNIAGQAPGILEAISLWRRNLIDELELERIVHYSNVRSDFLDDIKLLKTQAASVGEVITGRLKNHLDDTTAQIMFAEAGGRPLDYTWMLAAAGRPVSPEEMARLWLRAKAGEPGNPTTEADVDAAVAQSDINPAYTSFVKLAAKYIPPPRSVVAMLRSGAITQARATQLFEMYGVSAEDAAAFIAEASHTSTTAVKELSQAQVLRLYGAKFITRAEAIARLTGLKYDTASIDLLLGFADEAQHERYVNAVVTRIHAKFTTWKLTETEATNALIADQVPAAAVTDLVNLWKIERDASIHVLTPASIVGAYRRKQIQALECKQRLLAVGVQQADLAIVVADGYAPTKVDEVAVLAVVNA